MNIKLRNMTSIYISKNDKMLLLYRIGSRVVEPSWCGIGGHFEEYELNDPLACMLRELKEEVNISKGDLENLALRYITLRLKNREIRQNYYFFANLKSTAIVNTKCNEGKLEWVDYNMILKKEMPHTAMNVLQHYFSEGMNHSCIYGSVTTEGKSIFTEIAEF